MNMACCRHAAKGHSLMEQYTFASPILSYGLQAFIARWYRGTVTDVTQLRLYMVILDEAIPMLLRTGSRPTFVTINLADFWRRLAPNHRSYIVCCTVPHSRARQSLISCGEPWPWSHFAPVVVALARLYASALSTHDAIQWAHKLYTSLPGPKPHFRVSEVMTNVRQCTLRWCARRFPALAHQWETGQ
jgi:hypothetical protein